MKKNKGPDTQRLISMLRRRCSARDEYAVASITVTNVESFGWWMCVRLLTRSEVKPQAEHMSKLPMDFSEDKNSGYIENYGSV